MSGGKPDKRCDLCRKSRRRESAGTCIGVYRNWAKNGQKIEIRVKVCNACLGSLLGREDKEEEAFMAVSARLTARLQRSGTI